MLAIAALALAMSWVRQTWVPSRGSPYEPGSVGFGHEEWQSYNERVYRVANALESGREPAPADRTWLAAAARDPVARALGRSAAELTDDDVIAAVRRDPAAFGLPLSIRGGPGRPGGDAGTPRPTAPAASEPPSARPALGESTRPPDPSP